MKINSISAKFPTRLITIEETLDLIKHHSKDSFQGNIQLALRVVSRLLKVSGLETRYWLAKDERPIDLILESCEEAIQKSGLSKNDVNMVIYTGVARGFTEPGNAYLISKALDINDAECFDILDACMSFSRALNIAQKYLKEDHIDNVLIVNGEFNNIENSILYPRNYALNSVEQIEWTFPTFTVGDVASATIVSKSIQEDNWEWRFKSRADWSDLCTAPTVGYEGYSIDSSYIAANGQGNFSSYGNIMHKNGASEVVNIFNELNPIKEEIGCIFPHASSKSAWAECAAACNVEDKMYYVYPKYGNLVSASVPAGIYLAEQENRIQRGENLVGWVGSAGMSFSAYSLVY